MDLTFIILGIIKDKPVTGYDIKQCFDQTFSFFSGISFGSIYPALSKLEKEAHVSVNLIVQDGKPNRKEYSITETGIALYHEKLIADIKPSVVKDDFLSRLFFYKDMPNDKRIEIAGQALMHNESKLASLLEIKKIVPGNADPYRQLCLNYGITHFQNLIAQLKTLIQDIHKLLPAGEKK